MSGGAIGRREVVKTGLAAGAALAAGSPGLAGASQDAPVPVTLELDEIQATVLRPRPMDYVATFVALRVVDPALGRKYLRDVLPAVPSTADSVGDPNAPFTALGFTWSGLKALGVPDDVLQGFPDAFKEGMAARASLLGDLGESAPEFWDEPFGKDGVHILAFGYGSNRSDLDAAIDAFLKQHPGVSEVWRVVPEELPTGRTHLGYKDNISQPFVEGSGDEPLPGQGPPVKAGEFFLGYENERGQIATGPGPEVFWRNGTYATFRKLRTHVAEFRAFLQETAREPGEEEYIAAKLVGRWPSGAPLVLAPDADDPALGEDPMRNNDFEYAIDDPRGFLCPAGSHIRRNNPRDALLGDNIDPRFHRILRRGNTYGPMLPEGAEEDGQDRGMVFIMIGADIERQYEFVKRFWIEDGTFAGLGSAVDPLVGQSPSPQDFVIPARPFRRKLQGIPQFVTTTAGCYTFTPSLSGLRWLANLGEQG